MLESRLILKVWWHHRRFLRLAIIRYRCIIVFIIVGISFAVEICRTFMLVRASILFLSAMT